MLSAFSPIKEMKRLSVLTVATLAIVVGFASNSFGGDGRNGPETSGNAIPVQVDRALTIKDLVEVVRECDTKLLRNIYFQIYKVENTSDLFTDRDPFNSYLPPYNITENIPWYNGYKLLDVGTGIYHRFDPDKKIAIYPATGGSHLYVSSPNQFHKNINLIRRNSLRFGYDNGTLTEPVRAVFTFEKFVAESSYSELGELIQDLQVIKNLKIVLPSTGLKPINDFKNVETGKTVNLEINVEEHAKCLLSGIQKKN